MSLGLGRLFNVFDYAVRLFVAVPAIESVGGEVPANLWILLRAVNLAMPVFV